MHKSNAPSSFWQQQKEQKEEKEKKNNNEEYVALRDASFITFDAISSYRLVIAMILIVIQVESIVVIIYIAGCSVMHKDA